MFAHLSAINLALSCKGRKDVRPDHAVATRINELNSFIKWVTINIFQQTLVVCNKIQTMAPLLVHDSRANGFIFY